MVGVEVGAAVGDAVGVGVGDGEAVGDALGPGDGLAEAVGDGTGMGKPSVTTTLDVEQRSSVKFVPFEVNVTLRPLPCGYSVVDDLPLGVTCAVRFEICVPAGTISATDGGYASISCCAGPAKWSVQFASVLDWAVMALLAETPTSNVRDPAAAAGSVTVPDTPPEFGSGTVVNNPLYGVCGPPAAHCAERGVVVIGPHPVKLRATMQIERAIDRFITIRRVRHSPRCGPVTRECYL